MTTQDRIEALERTGKLVVTRHNEQHVRLVNPATQQTVEFYPTKGTIVRSNVRQVRRGLDAALRLIGVRASA